MPKTISLNADVGEGFGVYPAPMQVWKADLERGGELIPPSGELNSPRRIMELMTSASLACGFHAGDPYLISRYVALARDTGCAVGAHPSYPDRAGFGNRYMELTTDDAKAIIQYQLGALTGFLRLNRLTLHHVKVHGVFYHRAMKDEVLARAVAEAVAEFDETVPVLGLPGSALEDATRRLGTPFLREGFADRAYHDDGRLVDRSRTDAMVLDHDEVARRVAQMAEEGTVVSVEGNVVRLDPQTICFHSDTPGMIRSLERTLRILEERGIRVERIKL